LEFVTTSFEVGATPAAETLRVQAAGDGFAVPAKISARVEPQRTDTIDLGREVVSDGAAGIIKA
jgi:hypothetical protein